MAMPKATMDENHNSKPRQYNVGTPGKLFIVNLIPKTLGKQISADDKLRQCVL